MAHKSCNVRTSRYERQEPVSQDSWSDNCKTLIDACVEGRTLLIWEVYKRSPEFRPTRHTVLRAIDNAMYGGHINILDWLLGRADLHVSYYGIYIKRLHTDLTIVECWDEVWRKHFGKNIQEFLRRHLLGLSGHNNDYMVGSGSNATRGFVWAVGILDRSRALIGPALDRAITVWDKYRRDNILYESTICFPIFALRALIWAGVPLTTDRIGHLQSAYTSYGTDAGLHRWIVSTMPRTGYEWKGGRSGRPWDRTCCPWSCNERWRYWTWHDYGYKGVGR